MQLNFQAKFAELRAYIIYNRGGVSVYILRTNILHNFAKGTFVEGVRKGNFHNISSIVYNRIRKFIVSARVIYEARRQPS